MPNLTIDEIVGYQVSSTAEWRRMKAREFPDDFRNLKAAEQLDRLAQEISDLDGSEIHRQIDESLSKYSDDDGWHDAIMELNEELSAALRSVGFHGNWSGAGFLEWYNDTLETLMGRHVSAPAA